MKKSCLFLALVALFTVAAHADTTTQVLTVTTDAFAGTFSIDVVQDSNGAATAMVFTTPTNPHMILTLQQLKQGPQVIVNSQGHNAVFLSLSSDFDPNKGGHVIVRYLNNGIDGAYKDFRILVSITSTITLTSDPDAADPDSDGNTYSGVFNQLFMEKNTFFGQVIGVADVVPSYQP